MNKYFITLVLASLMLSVSCTKDNASSISPGTGQAGSLARFTLSNGYLYVADWQDLHTYQIGGNGIPVFKSKVNVGIDVETIYSYGQYLFMGSQNAMYIYDISKPDQPAFKAQAQHTRACDPVVVNNNIAYVTVRSGTNCGGSINALMVYDVSNITQPSLLETINMNNPIGLGFKGTRLYVCNGAQGMRVFDISMPHKPVFKMDVTGQNMKDLIVKDNLLIVMLEKGLAIYELMPNDLIVLRATLVS